MCTSQIQFTQGSTVGPVGQALEGVDGTAVVVSNGNNTGVSVWTFSVVDAPPSSVITPGVKQSGSTPTWSFTPDSTDSFLIQLTVTDGGTNTATDIREFRVRRPTGRVIPAFMGTSQSENYGGQTRGWAPTMEQWLDYLDSLVPALRGIISVSHATSPGVLDSTHQIAKVDTTVGGSIVVEAPATGGVIVPGWQIAVFDDTNDAATNPITVQGNGHNIEDPAHPGTLAASVQISTNSGFVIWMFEGTYWKSVSSFVTGGAIPLPVVDGGTGVTTLAAHAVVIGEGASALATAGPGTAGQVLTSNGASSDPTFQALPATTFPAPGSTISSATVLGATQLWALFTGGTYAIDTKNIAAGAPFYLTYVTGGGLLENTAVTIHDTSGSYGSVEYPANRSLPLLASQPLDVSWRTYVFCKDATNGVVRCIGFA